MPNYLFKQVGTSVYQDRFYHMKEAPSIGAVIKDEEGRKWRRVATKPQAGVNTRLDPWSPKDFITATERKGTMGDLWDRSEEQSRKRAEKEGGVDPIRQQYYKEYSKKRKGRKHPEQQREEGLKKLKAAGIKVDYGD